MKRFLQLVLIIISIAMLAACQSNSDGAGGFLWEVEQGKTTVYLQGTIHIGEEDMYPLHDTIEEAYEESDVVLPEIDLNNIDMDEVQGLVMDLATYEGDMTLGDQLPAALYSEVEKEFASYGQDIEMYESFQPWYIDMLITQFATEQSEYSFQHAVDHYFLDRAAEDGKEIVGLEEYEDQLTMLASFSDEQQIASLEAAAQNWGNMDEELENIVSSWIDGDMDAFVGVGEDDRYTDEFMKEINDVRNESMTEKIAKILENDSGKTYFVIVGTMHLTEEPSIVSMLEEEGFEVRKID